MKKVILFLVLPVLAVAGYFYGFLPPEDAGALKPRSVEVKTAAVEAVLLPERLALIANLEAKQAVTITPEVAGRIVHLAVKSGDKVHAGSLLVALDSDIQTARRDESKAFLTDTLRLLAERERLAKRGAISASELTSSQADVAMARARLAGADAELSKRRLYAPFDGSIGFVSHAVGAQVSSGESLMTLDQLDSLRLDLAVPQRYLANLAPGQMITINSDSYPQQHFSGELEVVDSRIDRRTMSVLVRYSVDNQQGLLKPGMLTRINLEMPATALPVVPVQALEYSGSDRYVYIVDEDNIAHKTAVTVGSRLGNTVSISSGLGIGDRIVVQGLVSIRDGQTVKEVGSAAELSGEIKQ